MVISNYEHSDIKMLHFNQVALFISKQNQITWKDLSFFFIGYYSNKQIESKNQIIECVCQPVKFREYLFSYCCKLVGTHTFN